jgi:predicted phosphodiesterase
MSHRKILVIGDLHLPWHDPKVVEIVLDVAKHEQVDEIVLNGDVVDFYNVSRYLKSSLDVQTTLEDELNAVKNFLIDLRKMFPDQKIMYIMGNHDARLDKHIIEKCPEFWNLFTLKNFCDFDKLKINYIPYNDAYQVGKSNLFIQHSPPSYSDNGARVSLLKKVDRSFIYNCSHREQHATITGGNNRVYHCWFNGWLGSTTLTPEHKIVFSFAKGHENWQQCFKLIDLINEVDYYVNSVSITNGRCVVNNILYG